MVGVSSKAVSKWETGRSKPGVDVLKKLSIIFKIGLDELMNNETFNSNINMIVITGGPCAGKSTALSWIQNEFAQKGYTVLFINESATELINTGIKYSTCKNKVDFQIPIMSMQLAKEKLYYEAATKMDGKILIVCDRGALDSKAYLSNLEFQTVMKKLGVNEIELRDNYDAVFHLVSAAKGAEEFYSLENNKARMETAKEAALVDDKIIHAWTGHPHLRIIDNSTNFENKIRRLIAEISAFLGEPEPFEIERKYLIEYPNIKELENMANCEKIEIIQTYLLSDNGDEVRIRQRGKDGNYIYYKTIKRKISDVKRLEIEKRLTKEEYLNLLMNSDPEYRQIRKTRYCLTYDKTYYEIDVYPFWKDKAILEVEFKDENEEMISPPFIKVIKEVTEDECYKNHSLAKI
jgi:CYTH domain-containing protein/thymidylate kinase